MAWTDGFLQVVGGVGGGAILTSIVAAFANRKQIGASTTETLTKTATSIATTLERQLRETRRELAKCEARHRERDELLVIHSRWDRLVVRLSEGVQPPITLPDPPALWPEDEPTEPAA